MKQIKKMYSSLFNKMKKLTKNMRNNWRNIKVGYQHRTVLILIKMIGKINFIRKIHCMLLLNQYKI